LKLTNILPSLENYLISSLTGFMYSNFGNGFDFLCYFNFSKIFAMSAADACLTQGAGLEVRTVACLAYDAGMTSSTRS
jgi:hypothetical protein